MNNMQILLKTNRCSIHPNVTNSLCLLHIAERLIIDVACTWMSVSNSDLSVWIRLLGFKFYCCRLLQLYPAVSYEYFMLCPCILGISQLDYYFLCRLLTGYSNFKVFWSNDFTYLSEVFLHRPLLCVSWRTTRTREVITSFSRHSKVYG